MPALTFSTSWNRVRLSKYLQQEGLTWKGKLAFLDYRI